MPFNGEEQGTINLFEDLMNEERNELYPGWSKIFSHFFC